MAQRQPKCYIAKMLHFVYACILYGGVLYTLSGLKSKHKSRVNLTGTKMAVLTKGCLKSTLLALTVTGGLCILLGHYGDGGGAHLHPRTNSMNGVVSSYTIGSECLRQASLLVEGWPWHKTFFNK